METWERKPEIVDGKLHKVVSVSSKRRNGKPVTAQIVVLYTVWVTPKREEQRSKTFHVRLGEDGHYHYRWFTQERNNEGHLRQVEHDQTVKAGFVLGTPKALAADAEETLALAA